LQSTDPRIGQLLRVLELEPLEVNLFRGQSQDVGSPQVFGGQVLGQALRAASATVAEARMAHSLHAYFLRRGDCTAPIVYNVDRSRDGKSFSSRRVVAIQHGEQIFNMAASFQAEEAGFDHQIPMPDVPPPEDLPDAIAPLRELMQQMPERLPARVRRFIETPRPFEFRAGVVPRRRPPAG
jgi:acyl-CoA thioesterase-2